MSIKNKLTQTQVGNEIDTIVFKLVVIYNPILYVKKRKGGTAIFAGS